MDAPRRPRPRRSAPAWNEDLESQSLGETHSSTGCRTGSAARDGSRASTCAALYAGAACSRLREPASRAFGFPASVEAVAHGTPVVTSRGDLDRGARGGRRSRLLRRPDRRGRRRIGAARASSSDRGARRPPRPRRGGAGDRVTRGRRRPISSRAPTTRRSALPDEVGDAAGVRSADERRGRDRARSEASDTIDVGPDAAVVDRVVEQRRALRSRATRPQWLQSALTPS